MKARVPGAALASLALLLALAATAQAHAVLMASSPQHGSRLEAAPAEASVTLTEPLDPSGSGLRVEDQDGRRIDQGPVEFSGGDRPTMRVALQPGAGPGAYRMVWHALSTADGHTTRGQVGFAVGDFEPPGAAESKPADLRPAGWAGRAALLAGLSLGFGALAFLAVRIGPSGFALRALAAGAALHALGILALLADTRAATGLEWGVFLASEVGRLLVMRLVLGSAALLLAVLALGRPTRAGPWLAGALLLGAAVLAARHGHASLQGVSGVAVDAMHLVAGGTWAGGLLLLAYALAWPARLAMGDDALRRAGRRFGTLAAACVLLLLFAGLADAALIHGKALWTRPSALLGTLWGAVLAAKVALVAAMLALAWRHRRLFAKEPDAAGAPGAVEPAALPLPRLRKSVAAEAILGLAAVALAGLLTSVSPSIAAPPVPSEIEAHGLSYAVYASFDPEPQVGASSTLNFRVEDHATGEPLSNDTCGRSGCIRVRVTSPQAAQGEVETYVAAPDGRGGWEAEVFWSRSGEHTVEVLIQSAYVYSDKAAFAVAVP